MLQELMVESNLKFHKVLTFKMKKIKKKLYKVKYKKLNQHLHQNNKINFKKILNHFQKKIKWLKESY